MLDTPGRAPDRRAVALYGVIIALLIGLACYNLFAGLAVQQVNQWDEARHIVSALEMLQSGDWLVTTYQGQPDYWNLKPPLSVWASALGFSLLDNPFLGVRLFSGVAALAVFWLTYRYARRLSDPGGGLLAAALLITAWPLFNSHAARTADPDMLMILSVTAAILGFDSAKRLAIAAGYVALGFAFLAKSFHVVPYGMAAFLHTVWLQRQGRLTWRDVLLLPGCFLIPVLPWALARYARDGWRFLEAMFTYDVLRRATRGFEAVQETSRGMYVEQLVWCFGFAMTAALALIPLPMRPGRVIRGRLWLPVLWLLIPLGLYTLSKTRLAWYIYPVFPVVAVMVAVTIRRLWPTAAPWRQAVAMVLLGVGMLAQESEIAGCIHESCFARDPVSVAITRLGAEPPRVPRVVYLAHDPGLIYQHYYATALMSGAVRLRPGGETAFAACRPPCWLIAQDGSVSHR